MPPGHVDTNASADFAVMRRFLPYLWPRDHPELRVRIVLAMLVVLASKGVQISMGFLYGAAIDRMKPGLEPGDELADGRWRQSKAGCGGRETFGIDHPDEGGHLARMIDHCRISELIS